jgi:hypothetical protein
MQHGRIRTSIPVEIRTSSNRVAEGIVRNASDGGMFVETRAIPPQGESVSLRFSRGGGTLEVSGLVWWTTEGARHRHRRWGFGMRLLEDDQRYVEMLAGLKPRALPTEKLSPLRQKLAAAKLTRSS